MKAARESFPERTEREGEKMRTEREGGVFFFQLSETEFLRRRSKLKRNRE